MSQHLTRAAIASAAFALALSGCTTPAPTPSASATASASATPTASASPSHTASPSPSPSPSVAAADCATEQIVPGHLGCIDTNDFAADVPAGLLTWAPDHCAAGDGRWLYTANPDLVGIEHSASSIIGRIDVYDPSLTTALGIHVGSTETEVAAAYGAAAITTSRTGTKLVVESNPEGSYVIELADGWGGDPEFTVANIRIYAIGADPNYPVYGTEDLAGLCPFDF